MLEGEKGGGGKEGRKGGREGWKEGREGGMEEEGFC